MRLFATFIIVGTLTSPTLAQVNRCVTPSGVVYQQGACAGGTLVVAAPPPRVEGAGKALCTAAAPGVFKDPASMQIGDVTLAPGQTYNGSPIYVMFINAKNGYGGYTGSKPYFCVVDAAETKVLKLSAHLRD